MKKMKTFNIVSNSITTILTGVLVIILACTIIALPLYFLWNWLMPTIFNLPLISIGQAFGLMLLSGLLFKSFGDVKN